MKVIPISADVRKRLGLDDITSRQKIDLEQLRWEQHDLREHRRRFVIALCFAGTIAALAGFIGYLIGVAQ